MQDIKLASALSGRLKELEILPFAALPQHRSVLALIPRTKCFAPDAQAGWTSVLLAPAYYLGLVLGLRLFPRFSDTRFRQFTLVLLIVVSTGILLA